MNSAKYIFIRNDHSPVLHQLENFLKSSFLPLVPLRIPGHFLMLSGQAMLWLAVFISLGNEVASWWRYPICASLMTGYLIGAVGGRLQAQKRMRYSALTELLGHTGDAFAIGQLLFILSELFFIEDPTLSAYVLTSLYLAYYATSFRQHRSGEWATERFSFTEGFVVAILLTLLSSIPLVKVLLLQTVYNHYTLIEFLLLLTTIAAIYTTIIQLVKALKAGEKGITRKFMMAVIWLVLFASSANIHFGTRAIYLFTSFYAVSYLIRLKNHFLLRKEDPQADLIGPVLLVLVFTGDPENAPLFAWLIGAYLLGYFGFMFYKAASPYFLLWKGNDTPELK